MRNKTGVLGVCRTATRNPSGTINEYYSVTWRPSPEEQKSTSFSIRKYGEKKAFKLAVAHRRKMLKEIHGPGILAPGWLVVSIGSAKSTPLGKGCSAHVDLASFVAIAPVLTSATGAWSLRLPLIGDLALSGLVFRGQVVTFVSGGPFSGNAELSNGVELRMGYAR